jgi:hypothetical protein
MRSDDDQRGAPLSGAVQSRHNLVSGGSKDPNHDAVMRIGSEAPKRRTHSSSRRQSQGARRDSATSNRHRRSVTSMWTRPIHRAPVTGPDAKQHRLVQRPPARIATRRSEAYAPRPRSWAFEYRERSRCGLETTASKRCSSGAEETATPITRTGQPFLPAAPPALVGRASEAGITRYSSSVAHVS